MILLEFAAQGIRGVAPAGGRATLRPGYNVVAADGAVLRRLLDALLFPDGDDPEPPPRAPGGAANAPLRAGLTLMGDDRVTYRLVRDFGGAAQLHRFDAEKRSFALVAQELAEIAGVLGAAGGVPSRERFSALLCLAAADLPSKQGGALSAAAAAPAAPRTAGTPAQLQKKIADLKGELAKARVSEKLQDQQDVLQARAFKLDEALKAGAKLQEGLDLAEEERRALEPVVAVMERLGDADGRIAAFEKAALKREEALGRVAAEREALDAAAAAGAPPALWRERDFLLGAGAGLVALVVGIAGAAGGGATRYLALLAIPAFGWAAWTALGWVARLEGGDRVARRRRVVDDWERKMLDQFEKDAADIQGAMEELGVEKIQDLRDLAGRVTDCESVASEWRRRLAEWRADPEVANARSEKAKVARELQAIEGRLQAEVGGFIRDVRSIEAEIKRLEGELANPTPARAAPVAAAPARPAGDPLRLLLEAAAKELGGSPAAVVRGVQQKASQTLTGITFQRIAGVTADDRGNVQAQTGGRVVPAATLPPADRDLLFIALKLALMEGAIAQGGAVAYVDDCFSGLSDGGRRLVARLLKQMARPGQIVHATSDRSFKEAADHSAA